MKRTESLKRLIISEFPLIGLLVQMGIYAYYWMTAYYPFLHTHRALRYYFKGHVLMLLVYLVLLYFFTSTYGGLKIGYLKPVDVYFSQFFSLLGVNVISYIQISLMANWLVAPAPIVKTMLIQLILAAVWVYVGNMLYRKVFPPREILLVYGERSIEDIVAKFDSRKDKYRINGCINVSEGTEKIQEEILAGYGAVVLWDIPAGQRNDLLKFCYSRSIRVYMMPKISDVLIQGSDQLHLFDAPIMLIREYALKAEQRIIKRFIDLICSVLLLMIASPIMLITAIVIRLYDKGPVLYKQIRCTQDAREFYILKFRSMRVDAEKDGVARLAAKNDDRITPERPEIIAQYVEEMPEFVFRMKVKAGLAGYAQVYGKYNTTPYDKLKLDLTYIENYSVWLDLKLMLLTLKILFKPESTEGVESGQTTAKKQ